MTERNLPSGVVTFMFTDIEGSTVLLQHLGDAAYDAVLQDHHRLLREAWSNNDGYEVKTEGDAFFVAFSEPARAITAAVEAQRALAAHRWPGEVEVRVRVGVHTGEARVYDNDYVGLAVHQAARIASAAHGGQVIVSEDAKAEAEGASFLDLGPHRLKDLARPVRLFQLVHAALPSEFPPPRTLSVMPHNFPIQLTTFVGRADDLETIRDELGSSRLVTLTGSGGVGKTRLALQVGAEVLDRFADGAWFVDLAPLSDQSLVGGTIAGALGLRDQPGRPISATLVDHLIGKQTLLVIDNCEHVLDATAKTVHQILTSCPDVRILTTSREALNIPGETEWRLRSLEVPQMIATDDLGTVARNESVRLFVQRARAVRPGFDLTGENAEAVAKICRRLDGLPLAIELAGARVRSMSPAEIVERLDDRFRILTGGSRAALPRHRTLEATVSWSYDLLTEPERLLFRRLTVFSGGWTLVAAEEVCVDDELEAFDIPDLLGQLVERSVVVTDEASDGTTRYRFLETLRQFGSERLRASGEQDEMRDRHLYWAVSFAEAAPPQIGHLLPPELAAEEANLIAALGRAMESSDHTSALRIVSSAWIGQLSERARWLKLLLPYAEGLPDDVRTKSFFAAGALGFMIGEWPWGFDSMAAAAGASRASGDHLRYGLSLIYQGACAWGMGEIALCRRLVEEGRRAANAAGVPEAEVRAYIILTWMASETDLGEANRLAAEWDEIASRIGSVFDKGHQREAVGFVRCLEGRYEDAAATLLEAVELFRDIQVNCASHLLETVAAWAAGLQRYEEAARIVGAADRLREETGDEPRPWERVVREEWLPRIRPALGDEAFATAHERGRAMGFESALRHVQSVLTR